MRRAYCFVPVTPTRCLGSLRERCNMDSNTDEKPVNLASRGKRHLRKSWAPAVVALCVMDLAIASALVLVSAPSSGYEELTPAAELADDDGDAALSDAERVARWAAATGDAGRRPFVIVDKAAARVMAFEASGLLRSSTPALLGLALGDDSVPGIGTRPIPDVRPEERITPAGRFIARAGTNLDGEDVVWVDYDAAVSMHRVRATKASEQRLERLASDTIADNRISYGCINLPAAFYDAVISPMVKAAPVVIYVLPETRALRDVFAMNRFDRRVASQTP
jgi:hypothetical protein